MGQPETTLSEQTCGTHCQLAAGSGPPCFAVTIVKCACVVV